MDLPEKLSPTDIKISKACSGISGGVKDMEYHNMGLLGYSIWYDDEKICEGSYKFGNNKLQQYKMVTDVGVEKIHSLFCRIKMN